MRHRNPANLIAWKFGCTSKLHCHWSKHIYSQPKPDNYQLTCTSCGSSWWFIRSTSCTSSWRVTRRRHRSAQSCTKAQRFMLSYTLLLSKITNQWS